MSKILEHLATAGGVEYDRLVEQSGVDPRLIQKILTPIKNTSVVFDDWGINVDVSFLLVKNDGFVYIYTIGDGLLGQIQTLEKTEEHITIHEWVVRFAPPRDYKA